MTTAQSRDVFTVGGQSFQGREADDFVTAGERLLREHDVRDMAVDGRAITNIEMHCVTAWRHSLAGFADRFCRELDQFLSEENSWDTH
jgi:hypothetical protein